MHYLIYKITNTINNKIYIGCHKTENKDDGYMGSSVILDRAIKKYGKEYFEKEILFECESFDTMIEYEKDIVNEEFVSRLDTYNITLGGGNGYYYINKHGLNNSGRQKEALKEKMEDEEWFAEYRQKVSNGLRLYIKHNGAIWQGKKHKEESKRKIGEANSKHQKGSGNSQYGTCWVYNDKESKRIKKDELNYYLSEGWIKGRKIKWS